MAPYVLPRRKTLILNLVRAPLDQLIYLRPHHTQCVTLDEEKGEQPSSMSLESARSDSQKFDQAVMSSIALLIVTALAVSTVSLLFLILDSIVGMEGRKI